MIETLERKLKLPESDAPTWLLWVAAGAVILSAAALGGGLGLHIAGYALASLFAFTAIAIFRRRSRELSLAAGIGVGRTAKLLAIGILLAGFAISIAHSWFIASHLS